MPITKETLFVGRLPAGPIDYSKIVAVDSRATAEIVPEGALIQRWDYVTLNEGVPRPSELLPLRQLSDDLADAVVDFLDLKAGQDALSAIMKELEKSEPEPCVAEFWKDVNREPPEDVTGYAEAVEDEKIGAEERGRPDGAMRRNERFGADGRQPSLEEGQAVFWRYSGGIFTALMHFSLAGGFSSPNLSATMKATGYLTSNSRDATYRRLIETTLFVLDAMSDMRVGEGKGWQSAVRVRLLHATVRRKIAKAVGGHLKYSYEESGIPINQSDLSTVLGSFMIAPIWSLRRSGIHLSPFELASYQAAWRHVGFYLGISPALLTQFYGQSFAAAESSFASLAFDAFPEEIPPASDAYSTPTYKILSAVSDRPPRGQSVGHHCELSRRLLGTGLADQLALPRGTLIERAMVEVELYLGWTFVHFGRAWRAGWEQDRQAWFRNVIPLLVLYNLGERRSTFAWRQEHRREEKLGEDEGEAPGVLMGKAVGMEVRRRWYWLIGEMVVVLSAGGIGGAVGLAWAGRSLYRAFA